MEPIDFPERNNLVARDQSEYTTLPSYINPGPRGEVIFCLKLSITERIKILFTGKLWCCLLCFHKPVTPSFFSVDKSDLLK